jgi:hypothetical protein
LKKLAVAGAALNVPLSELHAQSTPTAVDIVQFALNQEYLEAEFYSVATTGLTLEQRGIPTAGDGITGPTVTAYGRVSFGNNLVLTSKSAQDIATDETDHVIVLRTALTANGVTPVAKPPINLDAMASMGASLANQQTFLVLARAFEDVGLSAYAGGAQFLAGSPFLMTAARITGVEGEHVANLRLEIARLGIPTFPLDGADVLPPPSGNNMFSTNVANGLCAFRTPGEVLYIVYGMRANASSGGFFPDGVNGNIRTSTGPATSANLS